MDEKKVSLALHVEELRMRLIWILILLVMTFVMGLFIAMPLMHGLEHAAQSSHMKLHVFRLTDAFEIFIQLAFVIGVILASPFICYQIWAFVKPGLHPSEQRAIWRYIPWILLLFAGGLLFGYLIVFPYSFHFFYRFNTGLQVENTIGLFDYIHFFLQTTLPFGFVCQMPLLTMFLTRLQLIEPHFFRKYRKYAYFLLLVIAGVIAPPELTTHLMITCPLIALYEFSILISVRTQKKMTHVRLGAER
ncbi:twin-arginine translocase subunit TatC [Bacillus sp. NPDC093026]|uniref:twin-arginine translocase subunit TatC n=1 Tax=Bacillus sp. NPDC093026 TaxID=3363948 RepID=UPI00381173AB